jgi:2-isopropylmalate synthase
MQKRIKIFDTTLRDGEQSPGSSLSLDQKVEMALALERLGVDRLDAGCPGLSLQQFEAVKRVAAAVKNCQVVGLARAIKADIDAVSDSLQGAGKPMLHLFIATSPQRREFVLHKSREQVLESVARSLDYARGRFGDIEFSFEDATRTELGFLFDVIRAAVAHGATTINIPDTVGYAIPGEFAQLIRNVREQVPEIAACDLSVHCHNDMGLAVANSIAALTAGASQVEVTLNGIGERAGNCALEELVMALQVRRDLLGFTTGIRSELLYPSSRLLQTATGMVVARNKPIFGDNVFSHEPGAHPDGTPTNREIYEIMNPAGIGRPAETLIMGRRSGRSSFQVKLDQYSIHLSDEQFDTAFARFTALAEKKKEVYDEDLFEIVAEILRRLPVGYLLVTFQVTTGNFVLPTATVKLRKQEQEFVASCTGDGPVDALFQAINSAIGLETRLKEYVIQAIGSGQDAQGQVKLTLEIDGHNYVGRGASTDIIEASAIAHIHAVNCGYLSQTNNEWLPRILSFGWPCDDVI